MIKIVQNYEINNGLPKNGITFLTQSMYKATEDLLKRSCNKSTLTVKAKLIISNSAKNLRC